MKCAIIRFPGSNCDQDCLYALREVMGVEADYVWHKETAVADYDLIVLPGGFSYGDYLRCGAIARTSPIMSSVIAAANEGRYIIGICNGFQVLCEARLLPGALIRNSSLHFICEHRWMRVENTQTRFTSAYEEGAILSIPVAHGEGNYRVERVALDEMRDNGQIVLRYCDEEGRITDAANPNGSVENIAGICNREGNVFGLMPHPERACDALLGSTDGIGIFASALQEVVGSHK